MMLNRSQAVLVAVALALVTSTTLAADGKSYRLIFPPMKLDSKLNQAIEEIKFTVACGHIESVTRIPDLWDIKIQRAVSAVEEFQASAGIGTARLTQPAQWDNSILVKETDSSCFDLSGSIIVGGEKYFELPLSKANLRRGSTAK